ncbi:hypothetical protein RCL_jg9396.t1 [Rhizophagus clarus]|uniref:Uncharacterized protein n=1 Tax=Rhizophagus clarus TaxID=94130 RepID=A0A8H3MA95_9GLOM|nr:hypothetical protein RCL_jg9396.t1 [Rhizophagus clarus]
MTKKDKRRRNKNKNKNKNEEKKDIQSEIVIKSVNIISSPQQSEQSKQPAVEKSEDEIASNIFFEKSFNEELKEVLLELDQNTKSNDLYKKYEDIHKMRSREGYERLRRENEELWKKNEDLSKKIVNLNQRVQELECERRKQAGLRYRVWIKGFMMMLAIEFQGIESYPDLKVILIAEKPYKSQAYWKYSTLFHIDKNQTIETAIQELNELDFPQDSEKHKSPL